MFRKEYPRPNFIRKDWMNLNGKWEFEFDDEKKGEKEKWYREKIFSREINVPFVFQSEMSGIHERKFHDYVWYKRKFKIDKNWSDKDIILHLGAVDYFSKIYVNGELVGTHEGGHVSFSFNITNFLNWEEEEITVYVEDPSTDECIPRGKQYWKENSESIWYTRTTGIWQSVWLEPVDKYSIKNIMITPDVDSGRVEFEVEVNDFNQDSILKFEIYFGEELISKDYFGIKDRYTRKVIDLFNKKIFRGPYHNSGCCWTPENPNLFDYKLTFVEKNEEKDIVTGYFGMRKIEQKNGKIYLNNRPYYQKLVLDQGYWPNSLMTAPNDEAFKKDIEISKEMGFNGCRKHQKVEDPRFLYWADKLGFLVWGEMPSCIEYSSEAVRRITNEWIEVIKRDYNHPSIVTWVPLNESWGVPRIAYNKNEQNHSLSLYHMIHSLDSTRLVISNDGWELTKTDICAVHNYNHGNVEEVEKYEKFLRDLKDKEGILTSEPAGKRIYANGHKNMGEPILLTEFGGIAYDVTNEKGWGYSVATTEEKFVEDYKRVLEAVGMSNIISGFCYTQLTDVEQEINGLLTYDRNPKCDLKIIKEINEKISLINFIETK